MILCEIEKKSIILSKYLAAKAFEIINFIVFSNLSDISGEEGGYRPGYFTDVEEKSFPIGPVEIFESTEAPKYYYLPITKI